MATRRRWVFLVGLPGDEVLDGSAVEIRAETVEEAAGQTASWGLAKHGATFTLIGERSGHGSSQRFIASVPTDKLPDWIKQNERVIAAADEVAA